MDNTRVKRKRTLPVLSTIASRYRADTRLKQKSNEDNQRNCVHFQ